MAEQTGRAQSVWIPDAPKTDYPPLAGDMEVDAAVVGGGLVGLTTAVTLLRAGLSVALIEAHRVGYGVTGSSTAKLTALHRRIFTTLEKQFGAEAAETYASANQAGIAQIASWISELGIDCEFERKAAYTFTQEPSFVDDLQRETEAAVRAGLPARFVTETDLPFAVQGAVRVDDQAQFNPYSFCVGLARAIADAGGRVYEQTRATDVEQASTDDDPCVVKTEHGDLRTKYVVLATLLPFLDRGGFFARTHPSRSYGLAVEFDSPAPDGMYISAETPVRSVRRLADRRRMIVVGEDHKVGQDPDTTRRYADLETWVRQKFPVRSVTHRWSAQDYVPVDGLPYIGRLPLTERVFVVTGLNKWGLAIGAASAGMLADRIQGRENRWASLFDSERINVLASAKALITENLDNAQHFFGDRLRALAGKDVQALAVGEGAIVDRNGKKAAAYRDEAGHLHLCSPVCTHMGCYVQWNTAEKSWDCPCHGSRFDVEGQVLQGPAVTALSNLDGAPAD